MQGSIPCISFPFCFLSSTKKEQISSVCPYIKLLEIITSKEPRLIAVSFAAQIEKSDGGVVQQDRATNAA